jgi:3-hydroxyisobutyrate dehydrogenase-like beta-hydroxyacid dehydrogenase
MRLSQEVPHSGCKTQFDWLKRVLHTGVAGAKAATLSFLVGGTEESFILAQPILSFMGQRTIHCGPSGAGLAAKICNNVSPFYYHYHLRSVTEKVTLACARCAANRSCRSHAAGPISRTESCSPSFCNQ